MHLYKPQREQFGRGLAQYLCISVVALLQSWIGGNLGSRNRIIVEDLISWLLTCVEFNKEKAFLASESSHCAVSSTHYYSKEIQPNESINSAVLLQREICIYLARCQHLTLTGLRIETQNGIITRILIFRLICIFETKIKARAITLIHFRCRHKTNQTRSYFCPGASTKYCKSISDTR